MGGIGAHCMEDFRNLQMFVEAPSLYKDRKVSSLRSKDSAGLWLRLLNDWACWSTEGSRLGLLTVHRMPASHVILRVCRAEAHVVSHM